MYFFVFAEKKTYICEELDIKDETNPKRPSMTERPTAFMKKTLCTLLLLLLLLTATAQEKTLEQMGGVYYAYPVGSVLIDPAAPEGYTPFYISHYGRHGSRWLPNDSRYKEVLARFSDKHNLTRDGKRCRKQLQRVWKNARGNGGQLTPLGGRQHRGIAERMVRNFPQVFSDDAVIRARSSVVNRCAASMGHFIEGIHAHHPLLHVDSVTDSADMAYIAYTTPALKQMEKGPFPKMHGTPERLMRQLFKDPAKVADAVTLMSELHTIASDLQDIGDPTLHADLYWLFTNEEMRDIYERNNERMAYCNGSDPRTGGEPARSALSLWHDIETKADAALSLPHPSADLRFGHDTNLYRLLTLLQASSAQSGQMDDIIPMAANLQMVFFRNAQGDIIVRLLHNERDFTIPVAPVMEHYYRWADVKAYMAERIHQLEHERHLVTLNTMVGTAQANTQTAGLFGKGSEEHGQTLPAVLTPNGQNFWTPQTRDTEQKCIAPFYHADTLMQGIRASHWLVGGCTQDYGSFTIAAVSGQLRTSPEKRATRFSPSDVVSHPHYFAANLPDEHLRMELTASAHGAIMHVTPEEDGPVHLILQPNSDEGEGGAEIDPASHRVHGYNPVHRIYQGWGERAGFSGHLLMEYTGEVVASGTFSGDETHAGELAVSDKQQSGIWLTFNGKAHQPIILRMATSFTNREGCEHNIAAEVEGKDFKTMMAEAADAWTTRLHTIDVESDDEALVSQFYGALYRASFLPRLLSDADGTRPRFADGRPMRGTRPAYTDFSMWDTYRALHPLYHIIAPKESADMMQSLVNMSEEGGWLPIFPCWNSYTAAMIGDHCAATLADAYIKGIRDFDAAKAYRYMRKNAFETPSSRDDYVNGKGRRALDSYIKHGYIPMEDSVAEAFHTNEQTSRTLEYAYDDFAVAQMARALGETSDYQVLMRRAGNWRNVINPRTGYADGRHADGRYEGNTDHVHRKSYITEGATCHYTWYVPHDPKGLIDVMGGEAAFVARLDSMFTEGRYWHGNEPCHQVPYMFAYAGRPDLTQKWVHHILRTEYNDTAGGLSGNDDAGQMSAWYVFSAMGFYPVCPATDEYVLGSPLFKRVTINQANGATFTIEALGADVGHPYVSSATLDGADYGLWTLSHKDITRGATLRLIMGNKR